MKRRIFLKLAIGALMFPQLPTAIPNKVVISPGTALINGKLIEFDTVKGWSFDGIFDEVFIWNQGLTREEMDLLRQAKILY